MTPFQWALLGLMTALIVWMLLKRRGDISAEDAKKQVSDGALLLDVRTTGEFSAGHLPNALNIPLSELSARLEKLEPKDRTIIVYCLSGTRSASAVGALKRAGFEKVSNLGAMSRW